MNDPPRAPILTSVNVDYDSVELTWSIETMDDSYDQSKSSTDIPEITGYFLYAKSPQSSEWEERQVDSQQTSFTFTNLLCGSQYQVFIILFNCLVFILFFSFMLLHIIMWEKAIQVKRLQFELKDRVRIFEFFCFY